MKMTGYRDFDWEAVGFSYSLPNDWLPFPAVEPVILHRPGSFPTFGISRIEAMVIPGSFGLTPEHAFASFEAAWIYLLKRLNPYNITPGQLRGQRNDGTPIAIPAVMRVIPQSSDRSLNFRDIHFVAVQPFWVAQTATTSSGVTFS